MAQDWDYRAQRPRRVTPIPLGWAITCLAPCSRSAWVPQVAWRWGAGGWRRWSGHDAGLPGHAGRDGGLHRQPRGPGHWPGLVDALDAGAGRCGRDCRGCRWSGEPVRARASRGLATRPGWLECRSGRRGSGHAHRPGLAAARRGLSRRSGRAGQRCQHYCRCLWRWCQRPDGHGPLSEWSWARSVAPWDR